MAVASSQSGSASKHVVQVSVVDPSDLYPGKHCSRYRSLAPVLFDGVVECRIHCAQPKTLLGFHANTL